MYKRQLLISTIQSTKLVDYFYRGFEVFLSCCQILLLSVCLLPYIVVKSLKANEGILTINDKVILDIQGLFLVSSTQIMYKKRRTRFF